MKRDTLIELSCKTCTEHSEASLEWLINDLKLNAVIEEKPNDLPSIKIYFKNKHEAKNAKIMLQKSPSFYFSNFKTGSLPHSRWATRWKKGLKAIRISQNLVISPSWIKYLKKGREKVIRIDPEMAFGTGHHDTTRMCLEWLEGLVSSAQSVCDVGCGSGILAIGAAKLGIKKILALDIDSEAVKIAQKNARLNGVLPKIRFLSGSLKEQKIKNHYDVILANLTAQDIQKNWKELKALADTRKTLLILAGIEKSQQSWFEPWLKKEKRWTIIDQKKTSDWIGYMLEKKSLRARAKQSH